MCLRLKMTNIVKSGWSSIPCKRALLNLRIVLTGGQSFRWRETASCEFTGVMYDTVWTLSQTDDLLLYKVHASATESNEKNCDTVAEDQFKNSERNGNASQNQKCITVGENNCAEYSTSTSSSSDFSVNKTVDYDSILRDYFHLGIDVQSLYKQWSEKDDNFKAAAVNLNGVRLLRQDPVETLFSFICSSNNNISRISGMVERMCERFGRHILDIERSTYHTFPSISRLASPGVETTLRDLGFGYRAKFIAQTAQALLQTNNCIDKETQCHCPVSNYEPSCCLCHWRSESYEEARAKLLQLPGVGPKVADCVCLMSLDKLDVVPVDTHVWQIASRDYKFVHSTTTKSLTDNIYKQIGNGFRELWGPYAGWAQAVLFASELARVPKKAEKRKTQPKPKEVEVDKQTVAETNNMTRRRIIKEKKNNKI